MQLFGDLHQTRPFLLWIWFATLMNSMSTLCRNSHGFGSKSYEFSILWLKRATFCDFWIVSLGMESAFFEPCTRGTPFELLLHKMPKSNFQKTFICPCLLFSSQRVAIWCALLYDVHKRSTKVFSVFLCTWNLLSFVWNGVDIRIHEPTFDKSWSPKFSASSSLPFALPLFLNFQILASGAFLVKWLPVVLPSKVVTFLANFSSPS